MSIGTRIIQIRNQKGLSQKELSQRSKLAASYLSRIENRRLEPRPKTLRKVAEALGVPVSAFFDEEGPGGARDSLRCAITVSGNCVMEMLRIRRRRTSDRGVECYTPHQLQLLRIANYLIQSGNIRLLDTLDVLFGALLTTETGRHSAKLLRPPATKLEEATPL